MNVYSNSLQEAAEYMKNVSRDHGAFNLAKKPVPFDVMKMDSYIQEMTSKKAIPEIQSPQFEPINAVSTDSQNHAVVDTQDSTGDSGNDDTPLKPGANEPVLLHQRGVHSSFPHVPPKNTNDSAKNAALLHADDPGTSFTHVQIVAAKRKIDSDWYDKKRDSIKFNFNAILEEMQNLDQETLSEMDALHTQMKKMKTENEQLKATVAKLTKEKEEHTCQTTCKNCQQPIKRLTFCSDDCIESNIQKKLNEN